MIGFGINLSQVVSGEGLPPDNPELVTNGTFDTDTTGWTAISGGQLAWSTGTMTITKVNADTSGGANQRLTLTANLTYNVSITIVSVQATARVSVTMDSGSGTNFGSQDFTTPGTYTFQVTPTVTQPYINIFSIDVSTGTSVVAVDNVSVKLA